MDRRKMLKLVGVSPALMTGSSAFARMAPGVKSSVAENELISVMNPAIPNKLATRVPLVPPLKDLNNKLIYLINIAWEGPDAANYLYGAMTDWLQQHYSGVRTVVKVTPEGMFGTDPALLKEMTANHVDAVIVGVAG